MADLWYYTCEGKQMEPVPAAELQRLAGEGILRPSDMVWKEGMPRWVRAATVPEFFPVDAVAKPVPVAAPAPPQALAAPVMLSPAVEEPSRPRRSAADERPRRRRPAESLAAGLLLALGVGLGVLAVALILGSVVYLYARVRIPQPAAAAAGQAPIIVNPGVGGFARLDHPDLDVFIVDMQNRQILREDGREVKDDGPEQDCDLEWVPARTGEFKVAVKHCANPGAPEVVVVARVTVSERAPAGMTKSYQVTLGLDQRDTKPFSFRQGTPYHISVRTVSVKNAPPPAVAKRPPPPPPPPPPLPPGVNELDGKAEFAKAEFADLAPGKEFVCRIRLLAGQAARVRVMAHKAAPGTSLELSIFHDDDDKFVAHDLQAGADDHTAVLPAPARLGIYRIRVVNTGTTVLRGSVLFTAQP